MLLKITLLTLLFIFWDAKADMVLPLPYSDSVKQKIVEGSIFSESKVEDIRPKKQQMSFSIAGLHRRSCQMILPRLSQYEGYVGKISFIEKSRYRRGRVHFLLSAPILPFKIVLDFRLPRINKVGVYSFYFDHGFLKGLVGNIKIDSIKERCLLYIAANWQGKHSGIHSSLLEFFSQALAQKAMESLFRITKVP